MGDNLPVYGFAGSAAVEQAQATFIGANLSDSMPEECLFVIPAGISKGRAEDRGMRLIRDWIRSEYDADDLEEASNVLLSLLNYRKQDYDTTLVLLHDPEQDGELVREAVQAGIRVLDLRNGMIELTWREPDPEPEPAVSVPRLRGVPRQEPEAAPAAPAITGPGATLESIIRALIREELAVAGLVPGVNKPVLAPSQAGVPGALPATMTQPADIAELPEEPAEQEDSTPWVSEPDPPAPTRRFTVDEEGMHRPRKPGRLASGLRLVELTDAQIADLKEAGWLIDE